MAIFVFKKSRVFYYFWTTFSHNSGNYDSRTKSLWGQTDVREDQTPDVYFTSWSWARILLRCLSINSYLQIRQSILRAIVFVLPTGRFRRCGSPYDLYAQAWIFSHHQAYHKVCVQSLQHQTNPSQRGRWERLGFRWKHVWRSLERWRQIIWEWPTQETICSAHAVRYVCWQLKTYLLFYFVCLKYVIWLTGMAN